MHPCTSPSGPPLRGVQICSRQICTPYIPRRLLQAPFYLLHPWSRVLHPPGRRRFAPAFGRLRRLVELFNDLSGVLIFPGAKKSPLARSLKYGAPGEITRACGPRPFGAAVASLRAFGRLSPARRTVYDFVGSSNDSDEI